jgi:hypothetical protein
VHRRRYIFEFQREFDSPYVINTVKTNDATLDTFMIRKPTSEGYFYSKTAGTRRQGRPKSKCKDGVNSDSSELRIESNENIFLDRP